MTFTHPSTALQDPERNACSITQAARARAHDQHAIYVDATRGKGRRVRLIRW